MENAVETVAPDVRVVNRGSAVQFHMLTEKAVEWMLNSLSYEVHQMMGANVLSVDPRYAENIIWAAEQVGLNVEVHGAWH